MRVSTRGDYASRALLSLALRDDLSTPVSVRDLAERTGLPQPYLEQILLSLKSVGLVRSKRGVGGGYVLARSAESVTLAEIVAAVDGPIVAGDFGEPHKDGACNHEGRRWKPHARTPLELHSGRYGRSGARRTKGEKDPQRVAKLLTISLCNKA
jgi:Rrf2 family protein